MNPKTMRALAELAQAAARHIKTSRKYRLMRAAVKFAGCWYTPTYRLNKRDADFRVRLAFEAGADWERRQAAKPLRAYRKSLREGLTLKVGMPVTGRAVPEGSRIVSIMVPCAHLSTGQTRLLSDLKEL